MVRCAQTTMVSHIQWTSDGSSEYGTSMHNVNRERSCGRVRGAHACVRLGVSVCVRRGRARTRDGRPSARRRPPGRDHDSHSTSATPLAHAPTQISREHVCQTRDQPTANLRTDSAPQLVEEHARAWVIALAEMPPLTGRLAHCGRLGDVAVVWGRITPARWLLGRDGPDEKALDVHLAIRQFTVCVSDTREESLVPRRRATKRGRVQERAHPLSRDWMGWIAQCKASPVQALSTHHGSVLWVDVQRVCSYAKSVNM